MYLYRYLCITCVTLLRVLKYMLQDPYKRRCEFQFVIPQSDHQLPAWFIEQSTTPSIRIKLDPNRERFGELIGLAMVFCFGANSSMDTFFCDVRISRSKNWKDNWLRHTIYLQSIESRRSDHLLLLYRHRDELPNRCIQHLESESFDTAEFSCYSGSFRGERCGGDGCLCGPFGVRLVYEKDIEDLRKITRSYIQH